MDYDVIIVGAGPAGMFAANELSARGVRVEVVERGKDVDKRTSALRREGAEAEAMPDIMSGVGGAGTFSDGTLNLRPNVGGDLRQFTTEKQAWELVREVDKTFVECGVPDDLRNVSHERLKEVQLRACSAGAVFIDIAQRHIGTDYAPAVVRRLKERLEAQGVTFTLETEGIDLLMEGDACCGVVDAAGGMHRGAYTLIAPGRGGASWVQSMSEKYAIATRYNPVDLGVRVEVPSIIMDWVTSVNRDPKFHIRTRRYDDFVRTFCTNCNGFVVKEDYRGMVGVNGHSFRGLESDNTNFALLVSIALTRPLEDTMRYGESVARLASTIGGGTPILQRLGDLRRGQRSSPARIERNPVRPTLHDVTPGDISMAMPHRIVTDILEALDVLEKIIPGVLADSTLLYAPEIKFYSLRFDVTEHMETSLPHLFAAGDGAGLSRGIVTAAATGILAARGILAQAGGCSSAGSRAVR